MPPTYFFLIDVSQKVSKSVLKIWAENLKHLIENNLIFQDDRTQIGFLTYDSKLHFYDFSTNFKVVVCEENPFPHSLIFNLQEKREAVLNLLDNFHQLWHDNSDAGSKFQFALETAQNMMKEFGGKLFIV